MGHDVFLVDPIGITGAQAHGLNWLGMFARDDPNVVSQAGGLTDMLVTTEGANIRMITDHPERFCSSGHRALTTPCFRIESTQ
jgi:hypothetical protein